LLGGLTNLARHIGRNADEMVSLARERICTGASWSPPGAARAARHRDRDDHSQLRRRRVDHRPRRV